MSGRLSYLLLAWLLLGAQAAAAETWYESYHRAEEAIAGEDWSEAIRHLNLALEQQPSSSARARTYGMRFIGYFPFLRLGIAYYHLGQTDAAVQAFETEQRQGEVQGSEADLGLLQRYLDRIRQDRAAAEEAKQHRSRQIVTENLALAKRLEEQGGLEPALEALAKVLAVAPDHPQAQALQQRLLRATARQQQQQATAARRSRLLEQARQELAAGSWRQASTTLNEVLEIATDDQAAALFDQAQEGLREELERQQDESARRRFVAASLARAGELERAGELRAALGELQAVLALEPQSAEAQNLQTRLLAAIAASEESRRQEAEIGELLARAGERLAAGDYGAALTDANRVLAFAPGDETALRYLAQAYARLSDALLAADQAPPVILLDDLVADPQTGALGRVVDAPQLLLTGSVYDSTAVELSLLEGTVPVGEVTLQENELQGVWITRFRFRHRLRAGVSQLRVVATDEDGQTAAVEVTITYTVPFVRSRWLWVVLLAVVGAVSLGLWAWRARRRAQLLQRRFNPYIAGAPILEQARFFGRQRLLDYVLRRIHNNSILLYGERRIGKTSFQHQLQQRLGELEDPEHQFLPVFIDLQGTPQERFFATLANEIFHELAPRLDGLQPRAGVAAGSYDFRDLVFDLRLLLRTLKESATKKPKLVLLIDEVDELNDYDPRINQKLRSLFMRTFSDSLVAVVSGVAIKKHWEREGSPWYNFFQEIEVTPLDEEEARALIENPVRGVFRYQEGAVDEILRRTQSKPYLIQRLCSELVDRMHDGGRRTITGDDVEAVCSREGL